VPDADGGLRVEVAGTVFEVSSLDAASRAWIERRYASFLTDRAPDVHLAARVLPEVPVDDDAGATIEAEHDAVRLGVGGYRIEGDLAAGRLTLVAPPFPSVLSPAAFRFLCALVVLRAGGVMLHAAAVVQADGARVFCGPSESGKTTVARLAGERPVLSDESVVLRPTAGGYRAWATPFFGEAGPVPTQSSGDAPLAAIFFLRKSRAFAHRRVPRREAVQRAFSQVFLPKGIPAVAEAILANLDAITAAVPCFELEFAARGELWSYLDAVA
jgi:hypothetical protein